jgi:hypothetical protein
MGWIMLYREHMFLNTKTVVALCYSAGIRFEYFSSKLMECEVYTMFA